MKKLDILNVKGEKVSDIKLNEVVFGIEPNDAVLYDALRLAQNSLRQGTHAVKNRSAVSGGGRKPWAQKGTGRARQGSIRSPQWRGGGVVFGPTPRSYSFKMNKKERRLALKSALAHKAIDKDILVVNEVKFETPKTKEAKNFLNTLKIEGKVLIVLDELTENVILATRNLDNIVLLEANEINVLDIVAANKVVVTEAAVKMIEEVLV